MSSYKFSILFLLIILAACRGGANVTVELPTPTNSIVIESPTPTDNNIPLDKLVFEVSYGEDEGKSIFLMNADGTDVESRNIAPASWFGNTASPYGDILVGECVAYCDCQIERYNVLSEAKQALPSLACYPRLQMWSPGSPTEQRGATRDEDDSAKAGQSTRRNQSSQRP
ncbi:MAG: hypothetical protein R3E79_51800 [Caldilineaceae bacterium]